MTELEKVEKLREKADVSFAEAKEALDIAGGDVLDALIYLEKQGRATVPAGGGYFSGAGTPSPERQSAYRSEYSAEYNGESFKDVMKRLGRFLLKILRKGNSNFLDASKNGVVILACPVTGLVILMVFFFWIIVPLFILSLFFGVRYSFRGAELGKESINRVMDNASNVVEDVKKSFADSKKTENKDETEY